MNQKNEVLKIKHLEFEIKTLKSQLIYGFYENREPFFIQGSTPINELCELVTAEQLTMIFHRLHQLQFENWQLKRRPVPACGVLNRKAFGICDAARIKL